MSPELINHILNEIGLEHIDAEENGETTDRPQA